jgi:hypothetical protein
MVGRNHRVVSKEEFDAGREEFRKESPDYVHVLTTPAADQKAIEELLGIDEGTFPPFICRFAKGAERCGGCGRHFSMLDFIKSGLQVHSKEFLISVAFGKLGGPVVSDEGAIQNCYECGKVGMGGCYENTGYGYRACYLK